MLIYRTIVADDEDIIREGIVGMLSSDPELKVVGQAENGIAALELARECQPDLLFVDITMPAVNGLEFIERVSSFLNGAVFVIITGYDDFEFIHKSLKLGVFDYLLKPVMETTLFDVVARAKARISENHKQISYNKWARTQIEKNLPALKAVFASNWIAGRYGESEINEQLNYLGIKISSPCGITVARVTVSDPAAFAIQGWDDNMLFFAAENIAHETFADLAPVFSQKSELSDLVLISGCEPKQLWSEAGGSMAAALQAHLPVKVSFGQEVCASLEMLPEVYMSVLERMKAKIKCSELALKAKDFVLRNFTDANLSLQNAAAHCYVSPGHLSRVFRNELGVTFTDLLSQTRLRIATELLLNSELKIHEIAQKTGYSTQHYFSFFFKRTFGVSPAEFRKSRR